MNDNYKKENIRNVSDFVNGFKYNSNTIKSDIDIVLYMIRNNINTSYLSYFRNYLNAYISRKADESERFVNFVLHNNINNNCVVYHLYEKYNLPFIHSRDASVDQYLFSKLFGIENIKLSSVIYNLCCFKNKFYDSYPELSNLLYDFLTIGYIDFESIGHSKMLGHVEKFNETDEEIVDNMEALRGNLPVKSHKSIVAHYSEFVAYNYLKERINNNQDLRWVSRDIGDGFGYDMAVVNPDYSASLYEVKGLYYNDYTSLTDTEDAIYRYSLEKEELDYHIMLVLNKLDDTIVDIHRDINNNLVYDFLGNYRCNIEFKENEGKVLIKKFNDN